MPRSDVAWGIRQGLLAEKDAVSFALCKSDASSSEAEFALAGIDPQDTWGIDRCLTRLVQEEDDESEDRSIVRWIFAILMYQFESAKSRAEWLRMTEHIVSEFGFPTDLVDFVSFMPPQESYDPRDHSSEESTERLVRLMYQFLLKQAEGFRARPPQLKIIPA